VVPTVGKLTRRGSSPTTGKPTTVVEADGATTTGKLVATVEADDVTTLELEEAKLVVNGGWLDDDDIF
jgi:hypothetical protein